MKIRPLLNLCTQKYDIRLVIRRYLARFLLRPRVQCDNTLNSCNRAFGVVLYTNHLPFFGLTSSSSSSSSKSPSSFSAPMAFNHSRSLS